MHPCRAATSRFGRLLRLSGPALTLSLALALAGWPSLASAGDSSELGSGSGASCPIQCPTTVEAGTSFELCGPSGDRLSYRWQGPSLTSTASRCAKAGRLQPGTYDFTLRVTEDSKHGKGSERTGTARVTVLAATTTYEITGPTSVSAGASFELCATAGVGLKYDWSGPGLPADHASRCVTISGLAEGDYTYNVAITLGTVTVTVSHVVHVAAAGTYEISGPDTVGVGQSFELCATAGTGLTYEWSGTGLPAIRTTRCVMVSGLAAGAYTFNVDVTGSTGTTTVSKVVVVTSTPTFSITGPDSVFVGQSFELCATEGTGLSYNWSGPGLPSDRTTRCVTVAGLAAGNVTFSVEIMGPGGTTTVSHDVNVRARPTYEIFGPGVVDIGESFQLCATAGTGLTYDWSGPGLPAEHGTRCVTISGLNAGSYTFSVDITDALGTTTVSKVVLVASPPSPYEITGPTQVAVGEQFQLCATVGLHLTYVWSGPGLPADRTTPCVTISGLSAGVYTFSVDITDSAGVTHLSHVVTVVGTPPTYTITGPHNVGVGESFELCATAGTGLSYLWSGSGLPSNRTTRCVTVSGLAAGDYTFTLVITDAQGQTTTLTHEVTVEGTPPTYSITGPHRVGVGESFQLCATAGTGLSYLWSGSGLPSDRTTRCVTVSGLAEGNYTFTLVITDSEGQTTTLTHDVAVEAQGPGGACAITGPTQVGVRESFTLCGPEGDRLRYRWDGPCGTDERRGRCIRIKGLAAGTYTFTLTVTTKKGDVSTCSVVVTVGGSGGGDEKPCPASLATWRERLLRRGAGDSEWQAALASIAACVDDRLDAVSWSDDVAGLRAAVCVRGEHGLRGRIRAQFIVMVANVCAAELGVRDLRGRLLGLDIDTHVSCKKIETSTVRQLMDRIDDLLDQCDGSLRGSSRKNMARLASCVASLNRGAGSDCGRGHGKGDHGDKDDDDHGDDDDERALAQAAEGLDDAADAFDADLQLERPTPNPFSETTRMQYVIGTGGADVEIGVYDLAGRLVQQLAHGRQEAGTYQVRWSGARSDGSRVQPGVYFLRGTIGSRVLGARIMYLK